jgi:flagellar biosynthesis protein FlhF
MQIKRFKADHMAHALRLVKQEFGSEAVILSARSLNKDKGIFGFLGKPEVEVTAATDSYYPHNKKNRSMESGQSSYENQPVEYRLNGSSNKKGGLINSIHGGMKALKDRYKPSTKENNIPQSVSKELVMLHQHLLSQGVEKNIALELMEEMNRTRLSKEPLEKEEIKTCLIRFIMQMGVTAGPIDTDHRRQRIVAFVGPPGVGKTTTIAKLAAFHALEMKKRVALITLDNHRIGGIEQLKIFARVIGIPIEVASDNKELKKCLKKLKNRDIILIDSAGISQRDEHRFNELKKIFNKMRNIEIQLLLDATTKENDLVNILEKFKAISISRLIFTKLDESTAYGNIFNQLLKGKIPISYFANGQQVPGDIEIASPEKLADLIMYGEKEREIETDSLQTIDYSEEIKKNSKRHPRKSKGLMLNGKKGEVDAFSQRFSEFYVANKNSDIFHYPDCKWANKIKPENLIVFESVLDAINKDYKPCRLCKPEVNKEHDAITEVGQIKRAGSYGY